MNRMFLCEGFGEGRGRSPRAKVGKLAQIPGAWGWRGSAVTDRRYRGRRRGRRRHPRWRGATATLGGEGAARGARMKDEI